MNSLEDSRMLEEYEILKEVLYTTTIKNMSHTKVKIAFKRRIEYHLKKTFAQVRSRHQIMQIMNSNIYLVYFIDNSFSPCWLFDIIF